MRIASVFVAPLRVTVLVPFVNVVPDPEVFQLPETVHAPEVRVIVPETAEVIVTFDTTTMLAFAVNAPAVSTVKAPSPVNARSAVARVPEMSVALLTSMALAIMIVPETVRL